MRLGDGDRGGRLQCALRRGHLSRHPALRSVHPADNRLWVGPGFTGNSFDPAAVADASGEATVVASYTAAGCTGTTTLHVQPAALPFLLGDVCQSEPEVPLPFNPPGGWWSGNGLFDAGNSLIPEDLPPGAISLTYNMVGCNGSAAGNLLPIFAGPTSTSCPEQAAFVPFPGFYPSGGSWSGPGIAPTEDETGLYDPGVVADGQWSPLIYLAPNGCSDTLWMFNRQTTITPSVLHFCREDETDVLLDAQSTPWCGQWNALDAGNPIDMGDCEWSLQSAALPIGSSRVTYSVNGCTDTLTVVVHPDSLDLLPWVSCLPDPAVTLPAVPQGGTWSGGGLVPPTDPAASWSWSPETAGVGEHALIWSSPPGCADTVLAEVESLPEWTSPLDSVLCFNDTPMAIPSPNPSGISTAGWTLDWTWDGWDAVDGGHHVLRPWGRPSHGGRPRRCSRLRCGHPMDVDRPARFGRGAHRRGRHPLSRCRDPGRGRRQRGTHRRRRCGRHLVGWGLPCWSASCCRSPPGGGASPWRMVALCQPRTASSSLCCPRLTLTPRLAPWRAMGTAPPSCWTPRPPPV